MLSVNSKLRANNFPNLCSINFSLMKNIYSLAACCIVSMMLLGYRISHTDMKADLPIKVTTWDALGYYMYSPAIYIYHDVRELKWFPEIEKKYELTGGKFYQANKYKKDHYVFKYLGGVSVMQTPFFIIGHIIASNTKYEADGFSRPYQYAIAYGAVLYCVMAVFLLRFLLLKFFSDFVVALSILLLVTATNLIQYVSVDSAMSHAYIFPLYALIIYATIKWHHQPTIFWASAVGYIVGLATICRPTEAVMLFIPLLWNMHTKEERQRKWEMIKVYKKHVFFTLLFGLIGVLPQLVYWKIAAGTFVYDVGSKWFFLNPFFRVLFGFENGWFVYTPITIFFIVGLFFIKRFPFKNSMIVFCTLNIWIIIAWSDWRYGGTYSTRALVQSYPVFLFPFTAIIEKITLQRWRIIFYLLASYFVFVNIFQLHQYATGVLHYRDMNRQYYSKIYLNNNPTPAEMSLMDHNEIVENENDYEMRTIVSSDSIISIESNDENAWLVRKTAFMQNVSEPLKSTHWLKINAEIKAEEGLWGSYLNCEIQSGDSTRLAKIRLSNAISKPEVYNPYEFFVRLPDSSSPVSLKLFITTDFGFKGIVKGTKVQYLTLK
jgi:hypothetical protein